MSSYYQTTKNPNTQKWDKKAMWADDYFGRHHYAVIFSNGDIVDPEKAECLIKD
ncbi:MAG: hypothetical protein ABII94_03920 [Patescibacteria group bacterium]